MSVTGTIVTVYVIFLVAIFSLLSVRVYQEHKRSKELEKEFQEVRRRYEEIRRKARGY